MINGIFWVEGPWTGRLGVAARPRGGDWLQNEIGSWRRDGIDTIVSLLTPEEEKEFLLEEEISQARAQGMKFISVPVQDRQVPDSEAQIEAVVHELDGALSAGKNVLIHCRQGIGRSGLLAACLLVHHGDTPKAAVAALSKAHNAQVPETAEQRGWIDRYASRVATADFHGGRR